LLKYDPLDFDGTLFASMDAYRSELLASADVLRQRVGITRALGDLVTGDVIAHGRAIIQRLDVRNGNPYYPPIFLTFLQYPDWIGPTDRILLRLKHALSTKPKIYRHFVGYVRDQPIGGLFELNVYALLDDAFPTATPQCKLPGSSKRTDVKITVSGVSVYVEATAITEGRHFTKMRESAHAAGQRFWVAPGPGPAHVASRIVKKIAEELSQTAADAPNILCISFFDAMPIPPARKWAIDDAWVGGKTYGQLRDGTMLDLSRISRVDSIFEFGRAELIAVHVNPQCEPKCVLSNAVRSEIQRALGMSKLMIR